MVFNLYVALSSLHEEEHSVQEEQVKAWNIFDIEFGSQENPFWCHLLKIAMIEWITMTFFNVSQMILIISTDFPNIQHIFLICEFPSKG